MDKRWAILLINQNTSAPVKNTGAAKHNASTRSSRPPAPVTDWPCMPQLVMPRSRFEGLHHQMPQAPATQASSAMPRAWPGLKGVMNDSSPPTRPPTPTGQPGRPLNPWLTRVPPAVRQTLAQQVLHHHAGLHDQHQEENQKGALAP